MEWQAASGTELYVDPRLDAVWLSQLGFAGDPWAQVPVAAEGLEYRPELGGWGHVETVSQGDAQFAQWVPASVATQTAFEAHVARNGLQEQLAWSAAGKAVYKNVRWVDRNGHQLGPVKQFQIGDDSIAMALAIAAVGFVAGPAIAAGATSSTGTAEVAAAEIGSESIAAEGVYGSAYEPFAYTSGEGITVASDAANVSYGFVSPTADAGSLAYESAAASFPAEVSFLPDSIEPMLVHATPETLVNDFGVVNYGVPSEGFSAVDAIAAGEQAGVPVAVGGGAAGPVLGGTTGVMSGGGTLAGILRSIFKPPQATPATTGTSRSSTARQNEISQPRDFLGQLGEGADPAHPGGGLSMGAMLAVLLGAGVMAYAAFK